MVTVYLPLNATCPKINFENYFKIVQNQEFDSKEWDELVFRLGFCGAISVPMLKKALDVLNKLVASNSSDTFYIESNKRLYIIKALEQIGKEAKDTVPELTAILEDKKSDDYLKYLTVNALGKIGSEAKSAIPGLQKLLKSVEDSDSVVQVTKALGLIGETEFAVSKLLETIKTTTTVRLGEQAALALAEIVPNTSGITDSLVEILQKGESNESRVSAALGLFAIGIKLEDTSAMLVEILENEQNSPVLFSTALALLTGDVDKTAIVTAIIRSIDYVSNEAVEWQYYDGGDALLELQLTVAKIIGSEMSVAVPALVNVLADKTKDLLMRERAIKILGAIGEQANHAVPALIEIVKNKSEEIALREGAITTLGAIGSQVRDIVNQLTRVIEDEQENLYIRSASITTLGKIGADAKPAIPTLLKILIEDLLTKNTNTKNDDYARRDLVILSAEALGKLGETKLAISYLLKIVEDNCELRELLTNFDETSSDVYNYNLVDSFKLNSIRGVGFAVQGIGISAVSFLITALKNSNLQRFTAMLDFNSDLQRRRAAVYGLAMIGQLPNEAIDILTAVVNNEREDLNVRRLAAYALENCDVDTQEFFDKMNLVPASKATCRDDIDFFDIYLGLCIGVPKNGGGALFEWIKKKLGG
ncbi:HEAT repeat domain-containing protein [Anabaena catenula]|uniref:HEAT repeat domain-containing protein n=1 Tax=Anabaena catenula FACHB-362 TaxID=2692877 RepID=A0ABR8J9N0_9NOST|nr:HEAT repeat domain-containing protein [Anabaena catenula]MBD2694915.1 HEAT repeat domain-containing protein [Anabaena catenula FACHB-362]